MTFGRKLRTLYLYYIKEIIPAYFNIIILIPIFINRRGCSIKGEYNSILELYYTWKFLPSFLDLLCYFLLRLKVVAEGQAYALLLISDFLRLSHDESDKSCHESSIWNSPSQWNRAATIFNRLCAVQLWAMWFSFTSMPRQFLFSSRLCKALDIQLQARGCSWKNGDLKTYIRSSERKKEEERVTFVRKIITIFF